MNEKNKNLVIRSVSALILLPVVVVLLWKGGVYSAGLTGVAAAICAGEYYAITLFAIGGMMLMAIASDLLLIFLALEILSLGVYILTAIRRDSKEGAEAAFKYFLLGGFSSAFFLYGIAFTYGVTGSTQLEQIGRVIAAGAMRSSSP